ncbi:hypothetical protein OB919_05875 [Halobacteria archaeon AArc-curdl1]|uniref:Uncharacterized protein n=1 Tax=Natronosalvus hydrolyticus TaxID=2979988 RepID=A0AAP3E5Z4_9EURY|nr:hypothetical protein [Halobacteria archaeon AArc-curdl1]
MAGPRCTVTWTDGQIPYTVARTVEASSRSTPLSAIGPHHEIENATFASRVIGPCQERPVRALEKSNGTVA